MKNDIITIISPVANEGNSILNTYNGLMDIKFDHWICIIDTLCQNETRNILNNLARQDNRIRIFDIGRCTGVAKAYIQGAKEALLLNSTILIEFDIGHPAHLLPEFIKYLDQYPLVLGTRYGDGNFENVSWYRKLISQLGTFLSRFLLQLPFADCTSGLIGYRKEIVEKIPFDNFKSKGHFYQTELKFYLQNCSFKEIPFTYIGGNSSLKLSAVLEALKILWYLFKKSYSCPCVPLRENIPITDDRTELLTFIYNDLQDLIGKEIFIGGYHLQYPLRRLLIRLKKLIEMELK